MKRQRSGYPKFMWAASLMFWACAPVRHATAPQLWIRAESLGAVDVYVDPQLSIDGRWANTRLGRQLSESFRLELERALTKAGYRLKSKETDLVLRVSARLDGYTGNLESSTEARLWHEGAFLERFEITTPKEGVALRAEDYPEYAAVSLVNAFSRSTSVTSRLRMANIQRTLETPSAEETVLPRAVVAVFDLLDTSNLLDASASAQLTEYLSIRLTQVMGYRLVPQQRLKELLGEEKEKSYRECIDSACQIELGKALAAEKSLAPKLIHFGNSCALAATFFDLRTETAELAVTVKTGCTKDGLLLGVDELVAAFERQNDRAIASGDPSGPP